MAPRARRPTAHVAKFFRSRLSRRDQAEVSMDAPVLNDDTRQLRFSRRFKSNHVEQAFREHNFQVSKPRLAVILLIFIVVELYILLANWVFHTSGRFRAHPVSQYGPFALLCCATLFIFSRWNNSRRLPYVLYPVALGIVLCVICPLLPAALQEGTSNMTLWRERYQEDVEAGRERPWHDYLVEDPANAASWVVASWYVGAFGLAMFGESAGVTPFESISLFWICGGAHCAVVVLAYHTVPRPGEDVSRGEGQDQRGEPLLFPHLFIAGSINTCLAFLACEARRKTFLVTRMRVEQLSREKERLEYERQFAETKLHNSLHASGVSCGDESPGPSNRSTPEACGAVESSTPEESPNQQPAPPAAPRPNVNPLPRRSVDASEPSSGASDIELTELNTLGRAKAEDRRRGKRTVQFRVPSRH